MITRADIDERVGEWGLRDEIVEKDFVLGWVLWGIGSDSTLASHWIFRGGTCLKKCYIETFRFSEDLDFTVLPGGPFVPEELTPAISAMLVRVTAESGIDFSVRPPQYKLRPTGHSSEGRIYYRGPRGAPSPSSIKLDLNAQEKVVRPTVLRNIAHPYPDKLPEPDKVRCYGFEEVFAEKIRAMGERSRPRDLYDIINLFRRPDLRAHPEVIRGVLDEKCQSKGIPIPTFEAVEKSEFRPELESEWKNMLSHQLPQLPPFQQFWEELPQLFEWLGGKAMPSEPAPIPAGKNDVAGWVPPPTVWVWGAVAPLEAVRFAAVNRLCVELGYQGTVREIEPYSLRRSKDGHYLLYGIKTGTRESRSYRVDRIRSVKVTTRPFRPVFAIEFSAHGILNAPALTKYTRPVFDQAPHRRSGTGLTYVIECGECGKKFRHGSYSLSLNAHKTPSGDPCYSRYGSLVDTI